jgi:hypothetical protein
MGKHKEYLLEGDGWCVRMDTAIHVLGVFDPEVMDSVKACRLCARQAHDGNADAIAAVLMCDEDDVLQRYVREYKNGK